MISGGSVEGKVVFYKENSDNSKYHNNIVVVESLDLNDIIINLQDARGIISENGGMTSHGAIILREINMPGLILQNARKILEENTELKIDSDGSIIFPTKKQLSVSQHTPSVFKSTAKNGWVKYREYTYTPLYQDFQKKGFSKILKILKISKERVYYKEDDSGYWLKGFPDEELLEKILFDKKWLSKILKERREFHSEFLDWLMRIKITVESNELTEKKAINGLKKAEKYYPRYLAYLYITNILADKLQDEFEEFLEVNLDSKLVSDYLKVAYHSKYVEKMVNENIKPSKRIRYLVYPPLDIVVFKVEENYKTETNLDTEIEDKLTDSEKIEKFRFYSRVCPILGRLGEEAMVGTRAFRSCINHFAYVLGEKLLEDGKINEIKEIENYTVSELAKIVTLS